MEKRTARSRRLLQPSTAVIEKVTAAASQRRPLARLNVTKLVRRDQAAKAVRPAALIKRLGLQRDPRARPGQPVQGVGHASRLTPPGAAAVSTMASASQRRPPAQLHIKKLASSGRIDEGLSGRRGPRLGRRVEGAGRVPRLPPTGAVRLPARRLQGALSIAKARKQQGQARLSVEWLTQAARGEQSGRLEEPRVSEQGQQPSFATHAQRRAHQADVAIRALLRELPAYVPSNVLGKAAERQVPDPSAREALLLAHFRARAGPSGENARLGLRARTSRRGTLCESDGPVDSVR